jgi:hypothetical protein
MYARIVCGKVAGVTADKPALAAGECAQIVECGPSAQIGWAWTPGQGCVAPAAPAQPDPNAAIDAQIAALEAQQTPRRMRDPFSPDAVTANAGRAWLRGLETEIAALRAQRTAGEGA